MSVKKVVGFLLPLKAFSPRNLTSFGLVALFCFVYVLAGGKFETKNLDEIRRASINSSGFNVPTSATKNQIKITGDVKRPDLTGNSPKNVESVKPTDSADEDIPVNNELESIKARFEKSKKKPEGR